MSLLSFGIAAFCCNPSSKVAPAAITDDLGRAISIYLLPWSFVPIASDTSPDDTNYYPNFDKYDECQKKELIKKLPLYKSHYKFNRLSTDDIKQLFEKCVRKEIADLDRDMMEAIY